MRCVRLLVLTFLLTLTVNAAVVTKAIKFGKLWDGHRVVTNAVVVV